MDRINVASPLLGEDERKEVLEVLDSGYFVQGPRVETLEEKWADYVGTDHAIAVVNGTAALHITLAAIDLKPGEEVIVPPLTFGSTVTAVLHQNGIPVFADINPETYCLDPASFKSKITDRTRAVIPVHLYGHPAEMDTICEIADDHDVQVIEDAAQAHGAAYRGQKVGSIGDAGIFSFYATKNITTGEGGIITTDSDNVADAACLIRNHGMQNRDEHIRLGYNYRMSELNAAIGMHQIKRLDEFNERRRECFEYYRRALADINWLIPATVRDHVEHAYFWAPFEVDEEVLGITAKQLRSELLDRGVEVRHRYIYPLYKQPFLREKRAYGESDVPWSLSTQTYDYDSLSLPGVESVVGRMIGLPNHPGLKRDELETVVETFYEVTTDVADG